jgi:hypothetical protein
MHHQAALVTGTHRSLELKSDREIQRCQGCPGGEQCPSLLFHSARYEESCRVRCECERAACGAPD